MTEGWQKTVVGQKELEGFHPAHAAYVHTQNQVSVMSEQPTALKEMRPFADIISKAEDLYVPSGPPISLLTTSYFTCWAFFDACAGPANETIGTTILDVGTAFGMHPELLRLRLKQHSRMGFYIHRAREGDVSVLEDLVTAAVYRAIVPAGYRGTKNENWFVRLLPPPIPGDTEHVVFTTPYIVVHPDGADWLAYFRRTFPPTAAFDDYERHMKYGPTREYWNDYVLCEQSGRCDLSRWPSRYSREPPSFRRFGSEWLEGPGLHKTRLSWSESAPWMTWIWSGVARVEPSATKPRRRSSH